MHYITNCMLVFSSCVGLWVALACAVGGIHTVSVVKPIWLSKPTDNHVV